ncbi:MAG TPA: ABC transporter permease [Prolixibacteraceae bacterium]|nr:ABC transporter permease [Prolixibacteraceae bacterium]HPR85522.1 ABC transporter permease [Prolixibacteraceae bacterium]
MGNHFKIYLNHLKKNKIYTFVTIFGFAVSLMFVFLLSIYIRQELSVDQFHANKDRIYRLSRDNGAAFGPMIAETLKNQYPEIETFTRIYENGGNAKFRGNELTRFKYMLADSSFFSMFSFKLKEGNANQVLATKNSVVLSESFARKMYGSESPVGKSFTMNKLDFLVTGVAQDFPDNTQFEKYDAIVNFKALADIWGWKELLTSNSNSSFGLYLMAKPGTDLPSKTSQILAQFKKDYWLYTQNFAKILTMEPLADVYFAKESSPAIKQNSRVAIFLFGGIAILILVIAIINYINLTVAQAGFRSKETAIKKLMGGSKSMLLRQHISESVALSFFATIIAIALAFLAEPFFNAQMSCQLNLKSQISIALVVQIVGIVIAIGFISGIIPALVVNKLNPVEVVKGNVLRTSKKGYTKALIAFQYGIAIVLLVCTWTIARQSYFLQHYNMGYNRNNLFWMENTVESSQKDAFRNVMKAIPGVAEVSFCRGTPIDGGNNQSFNYKEKPVSFQEFVVDSAYFNLFGMKVDAIGTAYSKNGVWINKAAIQQMELGDKPVTVPFYKDNLPVLGIVKDFNFRSLRTKIGPLIIRQLQPTDDAWKIIVRIDGANLAQTAESIKKAQASFTGGIPMDSGFIDDEVNQWYIREVKQSRLIGAFTILSIIISSMGIFAMSLYFIQQKVKEIGIRKVNGAKISEVMILLNRDFVKWVLIAFVIAAPIAYYAMSKWLENFAYRTSLSWWIFALAGILALGIALLTVSWQSWRAATRNPVEALRYE